MSPKPRKPGHTSKGTTSHKTVSKSGSGSPAPTAPAAAVPQFVNTDIAVLFAGLTAPETQVSFTQPATLPVNPRADPPAIKQDIDPNPVPPATTSSPFELSTGASDADSYHDLFRLQIAFADVWSEMVDARIGATGEALYAQWNALMATTDPEATHFSAAPANDLAGVTELADFITFLKNQFGISTAASPAPASAQQSLAVAQLVQEANGVADALDATIVAWETVLKQTPGINVGSTVTLPDGSSEPFAQYVLEQQNKAAALRSFANAASATVNLAQDSPFLSSTDPNSLPALLTALDGMLKEKYRFEVFAPNSVNFGLLLNYRQHWRPQSYQVGNLVSTIPLAPQEIRKYTTRTVVKKTRNVKEIDSATHTDKTEISQTARTDDEIVKKARNQSNFKLNAAESFGSDETYKVSAGQQMGQDQAVESSQAKREFHESVLKSAQEYRNEHRLEISTEETSEDETTSYREIRNPNDELTVTYLFYELQRRYLVDEALHKVTPVILVANTVPAPHEVDQSWLLRHDWILRRTILDASFVPALDYLSRSFAGAEVNLAVFGLAVQDQRAVVAQISQQVQVANNALNDAGLSLQGAENQDVRAQKNQETAGLVKSFFDPLGITHNSTSDGNADRAAVDFAKDALDRAQTTALRLQTQLKTEITALQVAIDRYTKASLEHFSMLAAIDRLRIHVKDNILFYMQAIWTYEPPDQRYFRLYDIDVPVFTYDANAKVGAAPTVGLSQLDAARTTRDVSLPAPTIDSSTTAKLYQVADMENLLGFKGNYMIFPLVSPNYLTWYMMQDYLAVDRAGVYARDPDEVGGVTIDQLSAAMQQFYDTQGAAAFATLEPMLRDCTEQVLSNQQPEMVIVPSNSLYIEALPGTHPLLEDFKLIHRAIDIKKAQAEVRHAELENLRLAARLMNSEHGDPDIEKMVVVAEGAKVNVDT